MRDSYTYMTVCMLACNMCESEDIKLTRPSVKTSGRSVNHFLRRLDYVKQYHQKADTSAVYFWVLCKVWGTEHLRPKWIYVITKNILRDKSPLYLLQVLSNTQAKTMSKLFTALSSWAWVQQIPQALNIVFCAGDQISSCRLVVCRCYQCAAQVGSSSLC